MTCPDVCNPCANDVRCDDCGERMCQTNGPDPRACGVTCADCPCSCTRCRDARWDAEIDAANQYERELR